MSAPLRIARPGIYPDMAAADYYADPCPSPSLTQSIAKLLIDRSPAHAWHAHPRLNAAHEAWNPTRFDLGNAAHWHLTGRGRMMEVVEADDWRTKAAQAARAEAITTGRLAVLRKDFDRAGDMAAAALDQLDHLGIAIDWHPDAGSGEAVIAWRDDARNGIWCRALIDWLPHDRAVVYDYKTTRASAAPHAVGARIADDGWCVQAAMHECGLDALEPQHAGRRKHRFVVQECEPPYALTVVELTEGDLTLGRKQLAYALDLWQRCMETSAWPGYAAEIIRPGLPEWAENRWLAREIAADHLMAG